MSTNLSNDIILKALNKKSTNREWEVERLRYAKLPGPDRLNVPGDKPVYNRVQKQHEDNVEHREVIVEGDWLVDVAPLNTCT